MLLLAALAFGCGQGSGETAATPTPTPAAQHAAAPSASSVARVVFIDQEEACECTTSRIAASWSALQAALGEGSSIPVERIHRDTQEDQAEEYRLLQPMVTVPGIYLLDEHGAILTLLQGEVTEAQVRAALGGRG